MKFELVDDAKKAWRWFSVQAMILSGVVQATWSSLSDDLREHFPHWIATTLSIGLLVFGVSGRLVKQTKKQRDE